MTATPATPGPATTAGSGRAVAELVATAGRVRQIDLDRLTDEQLREAQAEVQTAIRQLQAWQTRVAGALTGRARSRARAERPGDVRAGERAARRARREMADDLRLSPSQAKQLDGDDRRLRDLPEARRAFEDGAISSDHVRVLDRTLKGLTPQQRADLEACLVPAAREQDPVAFGRTCRAALADLEPEQALADLDRQHAARSARVAQRPDGMTHLGVDVAGVDGAFLHATIDAFRRPDARHERRQPEQRTADAFMEMVRAAAGTIDDPNARHGLPVFLLQLPAEQLLSEDECRRLRAGSGTETFTGPLPLAELERLIGNAHVAGLLADADGLPLAVTEQTRNVPVGLWRLLVARDGGCIVEGCDARAGWCQVAHLGDWFTDGGRLAPDTAGLLCTDHHRPFDRGRLAVTWTAGRPTVHLPGQGPCEDGAVTRRGGRYERTTVQGRSERMPDDRVRGERARGAGGADPPRTPAALPITRGEVSESSELTEPPDPRLPGIAGEAPATYRAGPDRRPAGETRSTRAGMPRCVHVHDVEPAAGAARRRASGAARTRVQGDRGARLGTGPTGHRPRLSSGST